MTNDLTNKNQTAALRTDAPKATPAAEEDRSQGFLERAGSNLATPAEVAGMTPQALDNDDKRVSRTSLHSDGRVTHEHSSPMSASTADRPLGTDAVAMIRSQEGAPQTVQTMDENSIITLHGGGEVKLSDAVAAGLLEVTEDGLITGENAGPAPEKKSETDKDIHPDLKAIALDKEGEAAMSVINETVSPTTQREAVNEYATGEGISEATIAKAASEAGVEPSVIHERMGAVEQKLYNQASDQVSKLGVHPDALWEWANSDPAAKEQLGRAVVQQLTNRTLHSYTALAETYISNLDTIDPQAILDADLGVAGTSVHQDAQGTIVVTDANGTTYSWKSAVAAGIISVSRK